MALSIIKISELNSTLAKFDTDVRLWCWPGVVRFHLSDGNTYKHNYISVKIKRGRIQFSLEKY